MGKTATRKPRKSSGRAAGAAVWKNRIVRYGTAYPSALAANPKNWRVHPTYQKDALTGLLSTIGWIQDVIVNQRTGFVLDGHLRVALAIQHHQPIVPVKYVDLTDAEEDAALLTFDLVGALAEVNADQLGAIMTRVMDQSSLHSSVREMVADYAAEQETGKAKKADDQSNAEAVLLDQAIQLRPARDYIVVMCDEGSEDFTRLKVMLGLREVRRGGYRVASAFDDIGVQRVVRIKDVIALMETGWGIGRKAGKGCRENRADEEGGEGLSWVLTPRPIQASSKR